MKKIELAKSWSYVTPQVTIDYPAGEHTVTNDIHAAAVAAGVVPEEEMKDGDGSAKAGPKGAAQPPKG